MLVSPTLLAHAGIVSPSLGTRTEKIDGREAPRPLRAMRPHLRASLTRLVSPTTGLFVPLHDSGGNPFLGHERAVTKRSPRENVVVSFFLQHPLTLEACHAQSESSVAQPFKSALPSMARSTPQNCSKRELISANISHALSQCIAYSPATLAPPRSSTPPVGDMERAYKREFISRVSVYARSSPPARCLDSGHAPTSGTEQKYT